MENLFANTIAIWANTVFVNLISKTLHESLCILRGSPCNFLN